MAGTSDCYACRSDVSDLDYVHTSKGLVFCGLKCYATYTGKANDLAAHVKFAEKDDNFILANIGRYSINEIMSYMNANPSFYELDSSKLVLSYYLAGVTHPIQYKYISVIVMGIILGVPKKLFKPESSTPDYCQKWYRDYETSEFNREKFLDEVVSCIEETWDANIQGYIYSKFTMGELIKKKCPLTKKHEQSFTAVSDIVKLKI